MFTFERERGRLRVHEWGKWKERVGQRIQIGLHADSSEPHSGLERTNPEITP